MLVKLITAHNYLIGRERGRFYLVLTRKSFNSRKNHLTCLHWLKCCELQHGIERATELVENLRVE